jgi:hypothetical protein
MMNVVDSKILQVFILSWIHPWAMWLCHGFQLCAGQCVFPFGFILSLVTCVGQKDVSQCNRCSSSCNSCVTEYAYSLLWLCCENMLHLTGGWVRWVVQ